MTTEEDNIKIPDENVVEESRKQPIVQDEGKGKSVHKYKRK